MRQRYVRSGVFNSFRQQYVLRGVNRGIPNTPQYPPNIYAGGKGLGPRARTHGFQGLPARGRWAGGRRRGRPWGPWDRARGSMGPVPWAQALASGIYIGGVLGWVLGGYWGGMGGDGMGR